MLCVCFLHLEFRWDVTFLQTSTSPSHIIPVTVLEIFVGFGGGSVVVFCFPYGQTQLSIILVYQDTAQRDYVLF